MIKILFALIAALILAACTAADAPEIMPEPAPELTPEPPPIIAGPEVPRVLPSLHLSIAAGDIRHRDWTDGVYISLSGAREDWHNFENAQARVRGRGNATWWISDKRPFRVRFNVPRSMFGTEYRARHWVLLANAMDYSLMRNAAALELGARMGRFDFSPLPGSFVHVYLDGDYRGVYQLTDQMQQAPGRVHVRFDPEPELSEFYIHWCRHGRRPGDIYFWAGGIPFEVRYPELPEMTLAHLAFVRDFIERVDGAIRGGDFEQVAALIDICTFVDFYIVNEFTKNADVFFSSVNFTVRRDENGGHRVHAGPLWDFDQSAGGTVDDFYPDYSPEGPWAAYRNEWFRRLMRIPEFRALAAGRWLEVRDTAVADTFAHIRYLTSVYRDCFERNFERWPDKLGRYLWRTPPSKRVIDSYEGQVEYLLDWFAQRIIWMDGFLLNP